MPSKKAIVRVQLYLDDETKVSSVAEIMIMLELCQHGILFLRRFRVHGYTTDFVLVDMMVFLQIGHEDSKVEREHRRGLARTVSREFSNRWEVLYVREDMVLTNIGKLLPAIKGEVKRRRKKSA